VLHNSHLFQKQLHVAVVVVVVADVEFALAAVDVERYDCDEVRGVEERSVSMDRDRVDVSVEMVDRLSLGRDDRVRIEGEEVVGVL
jgi:hypothetical protein